MRDMVAIEVWWFTLDLPTRIVIAAGPTLPLSPDLAARIHEAGGVLESARFFTGEGSPGYQLLPDDVAWIRDRQET
ncbi:hypothetical protein AX769_21785 (plasmid) [Frondihabitans sp. PAMC 28766]|uniref:hypothetical protein n=1 Tax=Frondihabitans sp. PAMC 28766 TaxID=1795630 RepID=UPI00078D8587|nr:hypothetical protein [Frondihabitans sp. PAMC 28766]AMM22774.1 hypothetical protein AX769_21785 [Frondihabitans sp. PAMC 28766]